MKLVTHLTNNGYVSERVADADLRIRYPAGFHSELTGSDGDVVEIKRCGPGFPTGRWFEVFADKIEEGS